MSAKLLMRVGKVNEPLGQPDQRISAYLRIDDLEPRAMPAVIERGTRGFAQYNFGEDYSIFRNLRRGYVLTLSGDLGEEKLSLMGSANALREMARCVPRPFSGRRGHSVKGLDNTIVRAALPRDLSAFAAEDKKTVFDKNMERLREELLGPSAEASAPDQETAQEAPNSTR